ncbi:signal peptidase I [Vaginisenegalia massiliensis]|uniref:signal peptidase I n=1 Tax=Vaginisenegalia massiliensis TaxID=2058294 RepID=UPI000F53CEC0|nr:signal peptidase I [Vaginisenegalia massiliensis]
MSKKEFFREVVSFIFTFLCVFAVFWAVKTYVIEPFQVKGHSMDYTLADGERVLMTKQQKLERFDIVVLKAPDDPGKLYIKRIIGMPGDSIQVKDDQLYVNGVATPEPYLAKKQAEYGPEFTNNFSLQEVAFQDKVPQGKYFVMGDNRQNSLDSRRLGFIDQSEIKGEAVAIYWPFNKLGLLDKYKLDDHGQIVPQ